MVELVISIFIITIFSLIVIVNFPSILRSFAISRATYKLAQDLRKAQDLGLSGVLVNDISGNPIPPPKGGYGIYVNSLTGNNKKYTLYADTYPASAPFDYAYDEGEDSIVENINIEQGVSIKSVGNESSASINFTPPNPLTTISSLQNGDTGINIVLVSDSDPALTRTVYVNKAGLIEIK